MTDSPYVVNVTSEDFHTVVLEGSHRQPVLVDFWADWCAPCRMLTPVLVKLANEFQGKIILAKVNTEEQQELASQFGIRSLPTVQLFRNGQAVDQFMGALPESEVRSFLDRNVPRPSDDQVAQAEELLARGDTEGAAKLVQQALESDPKNPRVLLAAAKLKASAGEVQEAEAILAQLPIDEQDNPEAVALRGQLKFAETAAAAPSDSELLQAVSTDPGNSQARYQLAARRVMSKDFEAALEELLQLMLKDRAYGDDAARKGLIMIFDILGSSNELVSRYRNRMFKALH